MSVNIIQYAFAAGEISPTFLGRTDLEKYDLGLALARNWFLDYRGGLATRPGTRFRDYIQHDDKDVKFAEFKYVADAANTYVILFFDEGIRFLQEGAYVLEDAKTITSITSASPGVVTATSHGYSTGDWVKILGRTFEVGAITTHTFALLDPFGNNFSTVGETALLAATQVYRIYTVASPYEGEDLAGLSVFQSLNKVYLTHRDFTPRVLTRTDHTSWALTTVEFSIQTARPADSQAFTLSPAGAVGNVTFAVTAIDTSGVEGLPFYNVGIDVARFDDSDYITFNWDAVAGAVKYNIYRSIIPPADRFTSGQQVGFIGQAVGTYFTDNNILPDFTITPPQNYNPFADGAIDIITITAPGSGYDETTTVTITDPTGTGFLGFPIIYFGKADGTTGDEGTIVGVLIIDRGKGYTNPTVVFTGGGSGATATATFTSASGNNPALFTVAQQRGIYASTANNPLTLWGSRPGNFDDFSYSEIVVEDDSYEFTLDAQEVAAIKHLVPTRSGVLTMTQNGVWLLTGGSETSISPINALADPQLYKGISDVKPITIDSDILYVEAKGSTVRLLSYNDFSKVYGGLSMSILANHLFTESQYIVEWSYAEAPHSLVWAVRSDGAILPFTYVAEQKVYAWTQCWTKGLFQRALSVQEGIYDTTYLVVQRKINGRWTKMIETFEKKEFAHVEDAWCVDCGLALEPAYPARSITLSGVTGTITITASSAAFSSSSTGKIWRGGGGKGVVTYVNSTTLSVALTRDVTAVIPETNIPLPLAAGEWTLDELVTEIGGLWHLEGETLRLLGDGNVLAEKTVVNGSITLDYGVTRLIAGLGFDCIARTLPPTARDEIIEHRRKNIVGLGVRLHDSRGLKIGKSLDNIYAIKEPQPTTYGEARPLIRSNTYGLLPAQFDADGQIYIVQDYPLPATVLGLVQDFEVGDDND